MKIYVNQTKEFLILKTEVTNMGCKGGGKKKK